MTQGTVHDNLEGVLRAAFQTPGQASIDARFYQRAYAEACMLSAHAPYHVTWWARALAALSPLKTWPANVDCAWRVWELLRDAGWPTGPAVRSVDATSVPAMKQPTEQALRALSFGRRPSGPKVNAFSRNIEGDLRTVTIDRHMVRAAGFQSDTPDASAAYAIESAVLQLSVEYTIMPAECQAIIWAQWRRQKGLK